MFLSLSLFLFFFRACSQPLIGSKNTVIADPPYDSCVVPLFENYYFTDFSVHSFNYTPPANCDGPYAKVYLEGEISVTFGRQYDRTAIIFLGGFNIFFGTTAEPQATVAPTWRLSRDLTDYTTLFLKPNNGTIDIGNTVDSTYTGVIFASVYIHFVQGSTPAPNAAQVIMSLGNNFLPSYEDSISITSTNFPRNSQQIFADIFAESQAGDEFWYTCVPNNFADPLDSCGGTAFRETQILVDNVLAGALPIFPWIYTGGIDPYLWRPIPGVQTLNFVPLRIDLTPFAGLLNDGKSHTVAVRVFNANGGFQVTGVLLFYLDPNLAQVTGEVSINTITPPTPVVTPNISVQADAISGTILDQSLRKFTVGGVLQTSRGTIKTQITTTSLFSNYQSWKINAAEYTQGIQQNASFSITKEISWSNGTVWTTKDIYNFPLIVNISISGNNYDTQWTLIYQLYDRDNVQTTSDSSLSTYSTQLRNFVLANSTLVFNTNGSLQSIYGQNTTQIFFSNDTNNECYRRQIVAENDTLTRVIDTCIENMQNADPIFLFPMVEPAFPEGMTSSNDNNNGNKNADFLGSGTKGLKRGWRRFVRKIF